MSVSREEALEALNELLAPIIKYDKNTPQFKLYQFINQSPQLSDDVKDMINNIEQSGYYFEWEGLDTQNKYECGKYQLVGDYTWELLKQHIQAQANRIQELIEKCDVIYEESQRDKDKLEKISEMVKVVLKDDEEYYFEHMGDVERHFIEIKSILKENK